MKSVASGVFLNRVQDKLDSLSKMESQTALYMAENQEMLIYASITELAKLAGSSEATVTRVCTKLGYRGFQDLKVSVAREIVTPQEKIHEALTPDASTQQVADQVFMSAVQTLEMTRQGLDLTEVGRCIEALCKARRIVIIGNGNSAAIAMDAQHKFLRIGLDAQAYTDDHLQMIAVTPLTEEDVLIGISHSGSSRNIYDAVKLARTRGVTVISLTSQGISPISKLADIRLYTSSRETKYRTYAISSRMAELTIIDTLYTGVSLCVGEQAIKNFEALEEALVVKKF